MTPPLGVPFIGYAGELARTRLDALPFSDYADADPDRLPLGEDEPITRGDVLDGRGYGLDGDCEACNADAGEVCRPWCIGGAS